MKMFTPFAYRGDEPPAAPPKAAPPAPAPESDALAELRKQMAAMQEQLAELTKKV
jgi:polyhydroxyalkanoate synthesis regulator protein